MKSPNHSLRVSLTRRLALALASIGTVAAFAAYFLGSRYANLAYDRALFEDVALLAEQVQFDDGRFVVDVPPVAFKWLLADEGEKVVYRVVDLSRHQVAVANGELGEWDEGVVVPGQPYYRNITRGNKIFRIAYMKHFVDPTDRPVLVEIGETTGRRDQLTRGILASTVLLMATMIGVAVGMVWHGVGSSLAPLRKLEDEAALRSGDNLTPLDPKLAPQEVRGLIVAINRMIARVSDSMTAQRRFIANAAHQLRTPLAGLRLQAQLARKADTLEMARQHIGEVEESAARASHVIEQLLTLSKAEVPNLAVPNRSVDLVDVAEQVIERFIDQADRLHVDLGYEGLASGASVAGNEVLLSELLGNLVDNAIRYGGDEGRVTISTMLDEGEVVLSVADSGPGFVDGEHEAMFQRFYRPDSSPQGGAGLGLAIVKEIADRYRAQVSIDSKRGRGSRVIVRFPRFAHHG